MSENPSSEHIRFPRLVICQVAIFGALVLFQPVAQGQTFKPAMYQADSKTLGIQEAIDGRLRPEAAGWRFRQALSCCMLPRPPAHPAEVASDPCWGRTGKDHS